MIEGNEILGNDKEDGSNGEKSPQLSWHWKTPVVQDPAALPWSLQASQQVRISQKVSMFSQLERLINSDDGSPHFMQESMLLVTHINQLLTRF